MNAFQNRDALTSLETAIVFTDRKDLVILTAQAPAWSGADQAERLGNLIGESGTALYRTAAVALENNQFFKMNAVAAAVSADLTAESATVAVKPARVAPVADESDSDSEGEDDSEPVAASAATVASAASRVINVPKLKARLLEMITSCNDADLLLTKVAPHAEEATRPRALFLLRNDMMYAVQQQAKAVGTRKPSMAEMRQLFPTPKAAKASVNLTHAAVAQRVFTEQAGDMRLNIDQTDWMRWNGARWLAMRPAQLSALVRSSCNVVAHESKANPDFDTKQLDALESDGFRRGVEGELAANDLLHVELAELNTNVGYLACENGAVCLTTNMLVRERNLLITVRNDTPFDDTATCPTFLRVLAEAFEGRAEDLLYHRLVMGYTLQGDPSERAMFFHKGEGLNGKSLLLGAIMKALGDYAVSVSYKVIADAPGMTSNTSADAASPALARLMSRRMAYIDEVPLGSNLRDADLKLLAGTGTLSARRLGKEAMDFAITAVFHIACNSLPTVRGGQAATWKRVFPVAYTKQFDGVEDPTLPAQLEAERAGILTWLLGCAAEYRAMRDAGGKLRDFMPASAQAELESLKAGQNPFTDWIATNCTVVQGGFIPATEGWKDYVSFESSQNLDGAKLCRSVKAFVKRMGVEKVGHHYKAFVPAGRVSGFTGLQLNSDRRNYNTATLI